MTDSQYNALVAIRAYTYITAHQLAGIGLFKSAKDAHSKALGKLKKEGMISYTNAGITGTEKGGGREKAIYYLSTTDKPKLPNKAIQLLTDAYIYLNASKKAKSTAMHCDLTGEYLTCTNLRKSEKYSISTHKLETNDRTIVLKGNLDKLKKKL